MKTVTLPFLFFLFFSYFQFILAAPTASKSSPLAAAPTSSLATCNGHSSLCNVSYADIVYAGAHNSYAFGDGVSDNQYRYVLLTIFIRNESFTLIFLAIIFQ